MEQGKSWNLRNIRDTRENVIEAVWAAAFVPDSCKAMIVGAINGTHGNSNLIRLDAHCQIIEHPKNGKKHILHMDISEL